MDSSKEKYLDKIVEHLVNETKYDTDHLNVYIIKFPFSDGWEVFGSHGVMSAIYDIYPERFKDHRWNFDQEMIDVFGLLEHESDYVWEEYFKGARFFGNEYAKSDGLINESIEDKQKKYIDKVINHIVKNITIDSSTDKFHPKGKIFFPWIPFPLSISSEILSFFDSNDPWNARPNFNKYCSDNFGLDGKEMKIVLDKLNFIIKDKVKDLYDLPISRFNKLNESTEGKQKEFLDYVYNDLVNNTKFRDASYKDIDIYDGKCKSLQVGIRWGSVAPYFNYIPECLENYLKDYWGLTFKEIEELFWDKYEQHIINMVLSKKEHVSPHVRVHVDYLRESKIDNQTEFLKKVVDIMIRDTKPFNETGASVITPFIADRQTGNEFVLSAHYCKRMVDNFDDEFTMGKIFTRYLDMFGITEIDEIEEVMYWYFNDVYEKYFSRFFDDSYKTRPRLDEGIDLGFIDKVVDSVLKEIVWDFDRGLVYFPMIDYSAFLNGDGSFLAPLNADDPFSNRFSERYETNWHNDLMNHIVKTYGITGNEWNRVWGSLQGEIWEKTEEYWDSFTRGY